MAVDSKFGKRPLLQMPALQVDGVKGRTEVPTLEGNNSQELALIQPNEPR